MERGGEKKRCCEARHSVWFGSRNFEGHLGAYGEDMVGRQGDYLIRLDNIIKTLQMRLFTLEPA